MSTKNFDGEICFFCRKPIHGDGIEWQEQNNWMKNPNGEGLMTVNLHSECSVALGIRFIRDGLKEVKSKEDKEHLQRQVAVCLKIDKTLSL